MRVYKSNISAFADSIQMRYFALSLELIDLSVLLFSDSEEDEEDLGEMMENDDFESLEDMDEDDEPSYEDPNTSYEM